MLVYAAVLSLWLALDHPVGSSAALGRPTAVAAWVRVSVATVWLRRTSPRAIDAPALADPAGLEEWLDGLSVSGRLGLDSRVQTQVLLGQEVLVLARRGRWSRVEVPEQRGSGYPNGIIGWIPTVQLSTLPPRGSRMAIVAVPDSLLYSVSRGAIGRAEFRVSYDTELPVVRAAGGFMVVGLPGGGFGAIAANALRPVSGGPVSGTAVAAAARLFLGLPYLWGGTSAFGYDCSGLVYSLYARYGLILPRDAADQKLAGFPVALDQLRPGDLLFFAGRRGRGHVHHVAVYVGGGFMIDAPYTGASIEMVAMTSSAIWDEFAGATRVAR
jgi:hypothetical protein